MQSFTRIETLMPPSPPAHAHKGISRRSAQLRKSSDPHPTYSLSTILPHITTGRICITLSALAHSAGAFAADWSYTHVFNPRWTPHAKFHNGQTMSMGVCLALGAMWYAWRTPLTLLPGPALPGSGDLEARRIHERETAIARGKQHVVLVAIFGSLYWFTGLTAALYPGASGMDPEFGVGFPQGKGFVMAMMVCWVGCWLEWRRIDRLREARS